MNIRIYTSDDRICNGECGGCDCRNECANYDGKCKIRCEECSYWSGGCEAY